MSGETIYCMFCGNPMTGLMCPNCGREDYYYRAASTVDQSGTFRGAPASVYTQTPRTEPSRVNLDALRPAANNAAASAAGPARPAPPRPAAPGSGAPQYGAPRPAAPRPAAPGSGAPNSGGLKLKRVDGGMKGIADFIFKLWPGKAATGGLKLAGIAAALTGIALFIFNLWPGGGGGTVYPYTSADALWPQVFPYNGGQVIIPRKAWAYIVEDGSTETLEPLSDEMVSGVCALVGDTLYYTREPDDGETEEYDPNHYLASMSLKNGEVTTYYDIVGEAVRYDGEYLYTLEYLDEESHDYITAFDLTKRNPDNLKEIETYRFECLFAHDFMIWGGKLYYKQDRSTFTESDLHSYYTVLDLETGEETELAPFGTDASYGDLCADDNNLYFTLDGATAYSMPLGGGDPVELADISDYVIEKGNTLGLMTDGEKLYFQYYDWDDDNTNYTIVMNPDGSSKKRIPFDDDKDFTPDLGAYGWLIDQIQAYRIEGDAVTQHIRMQGALTVAELEEPIPLEDVN